MPRESNVQRSPNWQQGPEQRTEYAPPPDYPVATEIEDYPQVREVESPPLQVTVADMPRQAPEPLDWNAYQLQVDDARVVKVAGRNPNRRRLFIRNNDASTAVFIGSERSNSTSGMFELSAGSSSARPELELWHQAEVWAVCGSGDETTVSVVSEFVPQN